LRIFFAQVRAIVDYLCLTTAMTLDRVSRAACQSYFTHVWTIYRIVFPNVCLYCDPSCIRVVKN